VFLLCLEFPPLFTCIPIIFLHFSFSCVLHSCTPRRQGKKKNPLRSLFSFPTLLLELMSTYELGRVSSASIASGESESMEHRRRSFRLRKAHQAAGLTPEQPPTPRPLLHLALYCWLVEPHGLNHLPINEGTHDTGDQEMEELTVWALLPLGLLLSSINWANTEAKNWARPRSIIEYINAVQYWWVKISASTMNFLCKIL